jgi:hypothetical protein
VRLAQEVCQGTEANAAQNGRESSIFGGIERAVVYVAIRRAPNQHRAFARGRDRAYATLRVQLSPDIVDGVASAHERQGGDRPNCKMLGATLQAGAQFIERQRRLVDSVEDIDPSPLERGEVR